jgi:twitching motility protein PilT
MFPGHEQNRIKMSLASVLQGIVSQRLVKSVDGGRVAAVEILVKNSRIETLILEGREGEIPDALKEGKDVYGSQTFDQALLDFYSSGKISKKEALSSATSKNNLLMALDYYESGKNIVEGEEIYYDEEDRDILELKQ